MWQYWLSSWVRVLTKSESQLLRSHSWECQNVSSDLESGVVGLRRVCYRSDCLYYIIMQCENCGIRSYLLEIVRNQATRWGSFHIKDRRG